MARKQGRRGPEAQSCRLSKVRNSEGIAAGRKARSETGEARAGDASPLTVSDASDAPI